MHSELERKKPVWLALSEFFLDTDLDDEAMEHIGAVVIDSGYTLAETKEILMDNLFPALLFNLHDVAGEWEGFPEEWLLKRIEETQNPNFFKKLYHKANFYLVKDYWNRLAETIEAEQNTH
ncbi:hypothetical protein MLD52_03970 [Puniceicoccaceae bacterium K14]|nr:hypothetical protein [Puniceicoccaceae bacterium K14]